MAKNPTYRILGTTDEITTCDLCSRAELKGTVQLGILDNAGNVTDSTFMGSDCASRAAGWTRNDIAKTAAAADRAARAAAEAERQRNANAGRAAFECGYFAWLEATYGTRDENKVLRENAGHRPRLSPFRLRANYTDSLKAARA
jgi:putative salt-induced outer membrane protein YdiY